MSAHADLSRDAYQKAGPAAPKKAALASRNGSAVEFYDCSIHCSIHVAAATLIVLKILFSPSDPQSAAFGVAHVARPIGAIALVAAMSVVTPRKTCLTPMNEPGRKRVKG